MSNENETLSKVLLTVVKYNANLSTFKKAICNGDYTSLQQPKIFLRLLIWKTILITGTLKISEWLSKLHNSRVVFHQLVQRKDLKLPWSALDKDSIYYQLSNIKRTSSLTRKSLSTTTATTTTKTAETDIGATSRSTSLRGKNGLKPRTEHVKAMEDPLSDLANNLGHIDIEEHEKDIELLQQITVDVDRLFPGEDFFHDLENPNTLHRRRQIVEILYVWAKCNPTVGYKQGLHEILGLVYWNLYKESLNQEGYATNTLSAEEANILNLYNINYICHDAFIIFNKFILSSGIATSFYESETRLADLIEKFNVYLMKVDQFIHYTLSTKLHLESQLWVIRFLRLILLRELGDDLETTMLLWDKLISSEPANCTGPELSHMVELIYFITIHLLIQQKVDIVSSDFSDCLSLLLHYPIPKFPSPTQREAFVNNLFHDSMKLFSKRRHDIKLYEYGVRLNNKYNPGLKISITYRSSSELSDSARSSIDSINSFNNLSVTSRRDSNTERAEKMRFEKKRLEMRLKKKAQLMIKP